MNAEQFLSLADALRSYALHSGRDLNASNMFAHEMLMRVINVEGESCDEAAMLDYIDREYQS
jgi:hypothetical protein